MKLLYLSNTPIESGAANHIQILSMCNAFAKNNVQVVLALPESDYGVEKIYDLIHNKFSIKDNIEIILYRNRTKSIKKFTKYHSYFSVKKIVEQVKPDISFIRNAVLLIPCLKCGIPIIFESHNATGNERKISVNKIWQKIIISKSHNKNLKMFITISEALKKYWIKCGVPEEKIHTLHDGVSFELFKTKFSQTEARKKLGLCWDKKIVTYTGSLYPERDIDKTITLAEAFPDVLFLIVGGPNNNAEKYQKIARDKQRINIKFIGKKDHSKIPLYLYASDVLLALWSSKIPTINYCSPLKLFEYMAAGRIIIAHGFPTIKEIIKDGKEVLIAKPDSLEDLISKLRTALSMKYPSIMAEHARDICFQKYSWDTRAKHIVNCIKKGQMN